ncbi:PucR family transcriptional regulator [Actinomadura scrupuli]|uniref:PucR family transcriptional regulator n=1 Tax=Actinomadura scrupuli TaxID=559629 RepID=UPI003D99CBA9
MTPQEFAVREQVLRGQVPGIVKEAVAEIERAAPTYVRPHDARYSEVIGQAVEWLISHFLDLLADPETPSDDLLEFFRRVGVGEAREGRSADLLQTSIRTGAGIAVQRLTEALEDEGLGVPASTIAQVSHAVFIYLNRIAAVVAEGHAEGQASTEGRFQGRHRRLVNLLISDPGPALAEIQDAARKAEWPLPRSVAAVALHHRGHVAVHRPMLPADVLLCFHLPEPALVVADPQGPGRRAMLENGLRDWIAAIGPTVEITRVGKSLGWARRALHLARTGVIADGALIDTADHMPIMVMMRDHELVEQITADRLAPLMRVKQPQRYRLAETLLTYIEAGFNAAEVSVRLHVHAQTIRYRIRQLEALFGDDMHHPVRQLELHMVLHAWLATAGQDTDHHASP